MRRSCRCRRSSRPRIPKHASGIVDRGAGLTGDDVLMRDEAAGIEVRGVHLVGQNVLLAHDKSTAWFRCAARSCTAGWSWGRRLAAGRSPSTRCRSRSSGNRSRDSCPCRCTPRRTRPSSCSISQVVSRPTGCKRDLFAFGVVTVRLRSRAGKPVEQIVEAAVLLNDDDDMLDLAARGVAMDTREAARRAGGSDETPPPLQAQSRSATAAAAHWTTMRSRSVVLIRGPGCDGRAPDA